MKKNKHVAIIGAGLVGSLLSIYLNKRGYTISVFERRPDMRKQAIDGGRSINLALSNRGIRALESIGMADEIKALAIPMHGRTMHTLDNSLTFQPYGKAGQFINSISRGGLNTMLINKAENSGVNFYFSHRVSAVDLANSSLTFEGTNEPRLFDAVVGADGAFSIVRHAMQFTERYNFSQEYLNHGYKELQIPAGKGGKFQLEKNSLHIWPRESYMLIALPNPDGSFTCTLFFPFEGTQSFDALNSDAEILKFFAANFPDVVPLMPDLLNDYKINPTSSLVTMKCYPWVFHNTLLIGDAAHAIVPFYGQGMNAGFEDCNLFNTLLDDNKDDWQKTIQAFQRLRKSDADAIAQLALDNFIEMRDLVADEDFLLRKKIEAKLHSLYPDRWVPLYSMVTFHDNIPYSEAHRMGARQKRIMDEVMQRPDIESTWTHLDFEQLVLQLQAT